MRGTVCLLVVVAIAGCAKSSRCVRDPRYGATNDDHARGIPETIFHTEVLVPTKTRRSCQLLIEPTLFGPAHAIWFEPAEDEWFRAVLLVWDGQGVPERYTAPLDASIARDLDRACARFLRIPVGCVPNGVDGTFFHAAHPTGKGGYTMRSFWSPRFGTVEQQFAALLLELGDYVMSPKSLRGEKSRALVSLAERASARFLNEAEADDDRTLDLSAIVARPPSCGYRIPPD